MYRIEQHDRLKGDGNSDKRGTQLPKNDWFAFRVKESS